MEVEMDIEHMPVEAERKSCFSDSEGELELERKDEQTIEARIQAAETLYKIHNQASARIREKITRRKMDQDKYISSQWSYNYKEDLARRDTAIVHLQHALYDFYGIKRRTGGGTSRLLSPVEELDEKITSLHYRIQHGGNTIAKEKQIIQEIKMEKEARKKLVVNAAVEVNMTTRLKSKEAIEEKIKCIAAAREMLKKKNMENIDNDIIRLQRNLAAINQKKDDTYRSILQLRRQRDYASHKHRP